LDREAQIAPTPQQAHETLVRAFREKDCLHPNAGSTCRGGIIRAHSVSRASALDPIAENGKVIALDATIFSLAKTGGFMTPKLKGIKEASTFTGFCAHHDSETFQPIDIGELFPTEEQAFLLSYRALCREFLQRRGLMRALPLIRQSDKGAPLPHQIVVQHDFQNLAYATGLSIEDLNLEKSKFDGALSDERWNDTKFHAIRFGITPSIACSSVMIPEIDFNGKVVRALNDLKIVGDYMSVTISATTYGGIAVLSWLEDNEPARAIAASLNLIPDEQVADALVRFCFEFFENTYSSPKWWSQLPSESREFLISRTSAAADPTAPRMSPTAKDGLSFGSWPVTGRVTNLSLG
jgi:hypothetical protein